MNMRLKQSFLGMAFGALALAGCAKAPTEILVTVSADPAVMLPITSMAVDVSDVAGTHLGGGTFISLDAPPTDAVVAPFYFPARLQVALPVNAAAGDVAILIEGSDPTTGGLVTARGVGTGTIAPQTTTQGAVILMAVALPVPDGGVPDADVPDTGTDPDAVVAP